MKKNSGGEGDRYGISICHVEFSFLLPVQHLRIDALCVNDKAYLEWFRVSLLFGNFRPGYSWRRASQIDRYNAYWVLGSAGEN